MSTYAWRCRKPTALQVVPRLHAICANEGLQVADSTLQSLAEGANCDIRLILGQLQMIKLKCNRLEYDDVKVHLLDEFRSFCSIVWYELCSNSWNLDKISSL